jgi:hypothetical protein
MTPRRSTGSTLSVHRAFVVHLAAGGGSARRRFSGRVEHLSSGRTAPFSSLNRLLAFFAAILDAAEPTAPASPIDHPGRPRPTGQAAAPSAPDRLGGPHVLAHPPPPAGSLPPPSGAAQPTPSHGPQRSNVPKPGLVPGQKE